MCLSCIDEPISKKSRDDIFKWSSDVYLYFPNNKKLKLNSDQINEIKETSITFIHTIIDFECTIWAIQWPNEYEVKTIK